MKGPGVHIVVKIREVGVLAHGFVERFPAHANANQFHQCGFSNTNIACDCHIFFYHHPSTKFRQARLTSFLAVACHSAQREDHLYHGISPASSLSITCLKTSNGCAPTIARPLTKNVGVERTPRFTAKSLSAWMAS